MRLILVPVADRPECARALDTAFELGKVVGASISGCHMRPHRHSEVSLATAFASADWRKKNTKKAPAAAKALYQRAAEQHGYKLIRRPREAPGALWAETVGSPDILMGIVGPVSDLVVVSRPSKIRGVADLFLRAALLASTRPVLVLPQKARRHIGRRVVIAWNQSPVASRAMLAAVPILQKAEAVTIVSCGPEDHPGPKSAQAAAYLKHWGIDAERVSTPGRRVEPELMETLKEAKGDLLVAGAYSRNRWFEKVFGGTTEFLMHKARAAVFTVHD